MVFDRHDGIDSVVSELRRDVRVLDLSVLALSSSSWGEGRSVATLLCLLPRFSHPGGERRIHEDICRNRLMKEAVLFRSGSVSGLITVAREGDLSLIEICG